MSHRGSKCFKNAPMGWHAPVGTQQQGHQNCSTRDIEEVVMYQNDHAAPVGKEKGMHNMELPCLLLPRNYIYFSPETCNNRDHQENRSFCLFTDWGVRAMGNAGEGDVLPHIPFRPGPRPSAGCPASVNGKIFAILLLFSSRKSSQHAVPTAFPPDHAACKYSKEHNSSAGSGIKPFQR